MSGSRTIREIRKALLLSVCAASTSSNLFALDPNRSVSQYIVSRWNGASFPGGAIHAFAQTHDGYLWIGAAAGLVRFDGNSFRVFDHANTPTLPEGRILGLVVDSGGVLWVRMEGRYLLRYRDGIFEQTHLFTSFLGVNAMATDRSGGVLVAGPDEWLRSRTGTVTPAAPSGRVGGIALSIAETADGSIWLGMRDTGLFRVSGTDRTHVPGLPDQKVNIMMPGSGQELWIGTDSGLARWNGSAVTQHGLPSQLATKAILALARDRDSNLWVSTPSGITRLDADGAATPVARLLGAGQVNAIFEDREGSLWLGGSDGLVQLRDYSFLSYTGVIGGAIHVDDRGRMWVGPSDGGLLYIRGAERQEIKEDALSKDVVYSMSGGPGELWIGRRSGAITQLREEDGQFSAKTYTAEDGLATGGIYAVFRTREGAVWAGSLGGSVSRIHRGRITTFNRSHGLSGEAITTIGETPDDVIWVGTSRGLQAYRGGTWKLYGAAHGVPPGRVNSVATDRQGILWIAAEAGLFYWSGTHAVPVRQAPEFLRAEILGVAADAFGSLWVASKHRVLRLSRAYILEKSTAPEAVREFRLADGLPSTQTIRRDRPVVTDPSGRIWFAFHRGLSVIDPGRPAGLPPVAVSIESITVDGHPLGAGAAAHYSADRRRIVFRFNGVSLSFPGRVRYRYRLDEYDSEWSQPTESREAVYTNLAPGRYRFRLTASNGEGLWNGPESSVSFKVEPRFWQAWWFHLGAGSIGLLAVFSAYRYRLRRIRAVMNLRFEERLAERTRIAQELHDTLLQGFVSASMQLEVAADLLPENAASRPLVTRALELMQQVIDEGRNAVRGLRAHGVGSTPLETALSQIRHEVDSGQSTGFRIAVQGRRRELHPLLQDEVYRIAREALMNAFRHSGARQIEVELNYAADQFRLYVRDDGVGIDTNVLESGRDGHWGLIGMRERAESIGAQLHVFTRASAGTEVVLEVPSKVAFYSSAAK